MLDEARKSGVPARWVLADKTRLNQAYPRRADGTTLFAFKRLFVVASKT